MTRFLPSPNTWIVAALAVAMFSLAACSSSRDAAGGDRLERQITSLTEAVDLTEAQTDRVREILLAQEADRPSGPPPRGGRGGGADPRAAQRAEADRQIEAVLTEDQIERFRAWRASQPQRQGPPRGRR